MLTLKTLIDDLARGCKPKDNHKIGIELERFSYHLDTGKPVAYEGTNGIRALLERFAENEGWAPVYEDDYPIALEHEGAALTLEPGGQVEYSGPPFATLDETKQHLEAFLTSLDQTGHSLNIGFLSAGVHPDWQREEIPLIPKKRYKIMGPYMQKTGTLGLDMMKRTCGAQINLDFSSEKDMCEKFRVALGLQPVMVALMANSAIAEGKMSGYSSYRAHIWQDTDPDRCGFLSFVFDEDMSFEKYINYALDVPMYFFRREGKYIDVSGQSFRAFMEGKLPGYEGEVATLEDWHDHLTTLFPEVRLKTYLELRGADSNSPAVVLAMAAFWKSLFYDEQALENALELLSPFSTQALKALSENTAKDGLATSIEGKTPLADIAKYALDIASSGLSTQERDYLTPLYQRFRALTA
jgi:glutamate--cysteine ligase